MKYQAENTVSSFFYYMWNAWCEEECKTVFMEMYPHFWEKWSLMTDKGVFGAAERFYAELTNRYREKLVERAVSLYDGKAYRHEKTDPEIFVCADCGSPEVELKAWVNANTDEVREYIDDDEYGRWCNRCETNTDLCNKEEYTGKILEWWESNDCHTIEQISGLKESGYRSENDFMDAANEWWKSRDYDSRRKIYKEYNP